MHEQSDKLKRIALRGGGCVLAAILLEMGTIFGSPASDILNPDDWSKRRIIFFALLSLGVSVIYRLLLEAGDTKVLHKEDPLLRRELVKRLSAAVAGVAGALGLFVVVQWAFYQGVDLRPTLFVVALFVSVTLLFLNRKRFFQKIELAFLYIALPFGLIFCICMPVIAEISWDGQIHFDKAQALSYVQGAQYTGADGIMTQADAVVKLNLLKSGDIAAVWNPKQDYSSVVSANEALLESERTEPIVRTQGTETLGGSSYLTPSGVGYIPNAIGLWLARLIHLPSLGQYFFGRLGNLLFYCAVFYCAIKQLRGGKLIVLSIALLPTPFLMACNFAYDPWCFALITYSFSKYVSLIQSKDPAGFSDISKMLLAFFLGALVKAVLFPLALIFMTLPLRKTSMRWYHLSVVLTALTLLGSFLVPLVIGGAGGGDVRGGSDVNSALQIAHVLSSPLDYAEMVVSFTILRFLPASTEGSMNMFVGFPYLLAASSYYLVAPICEMGLLLFVTLYDREGEDAAYATVRIKIAVAIGVACAYLLIVSALYVSFTPVALSTINGVQSRYALPLLAPLLLVGLCSRRTCRFKQNKRAFTSIVLGTEVATFAATFIVMF